MDEIKPQNVTDPSSLTTQTIWREIAALKELIEARLIAMDKAVVVLQETANRSPTINEVYLKHEAEFANTANARSLTRDVLETRLHGMDKAIRLLQDAADMFPARIDEKIMALEKVHEGKFTSIDKQFTERDVRTQQAAEASTTAVNAALQAQKESAQKQAEAFSEATQKAETQFTKQIDQQGELLRTEVRGLVTQINELKDRFNRGEGVGAGVQANKTEQRAGSHLVLGILALLLTAAGIMIGILLK